MMHPLISVIIPVYNIEKYLEQCVDSVIAQSLSEIEIILVDDGSYDRCSEICDLYSHQDERVRVIHKSNGGLMSAWIAGVEICVAPYIIFVDGDDWIERDMCEVLYRNAESHNADICCTGFVREHDSGIEQCGSTATRFLGPEEIRNRLLPGMLTYFIQKNPEVIHNRWAKIFRRQIIIDNILLCDKAISIGEDVNIMFPVFLKAQSILVLGNCYSYHYRSRNDSLMKMGFKENRVGNTRILNDKIVTISRAMDYARVLEVNLFCSYSYYELVRDLCLSEYSFRKKVSIIGLIKRTIPPNISFLALERAFMSGTQRFSKERKFALKLLSKGYFIVFAAIIHVLAKRRH